MLTLKRKKALWDYLQFYLIISFLALLISSYAKEKDAKETASAEIKTEPKAKISPDIYLPLEIRSVQEFVESIGMSVHLVGNSEKQIALLREAGIKHIRDEISWAWVEKEKEVYKIPEEREAWVNEAIKNNIKVLLILNYGNPIYPDDGIGSAENPNYEFKEFLQYVEFMVRYFHGRINQWEIWNEPNGFLFNEKYGGDWRGGKWVEAYTRLANLTAKKIKALDPSAEIYTAGMEAPIADLIIPQLKSRFDAIAIHPYCPPLLPEYTYAGIEKLRNTILRFEKDYPLIVTEQGYPTIKGKFMWRHAANITEDDQAKFLLRVFCGNFDQNIIRTYWYDFVCDGLDKNNPEHNFGILNAWAESPRPAYTALKNLMHLLNEEPDNKESASPENIVGYQVTINFKNPLSSNPRGILISKNTAHYYLILWKESSSKDILEIDGENANARVFVDDGAPENVKIEIPPFTAGRLEATIFDPILGLDKSKKITVYSDGLKNIIAIPIKDYPTVLKMVFK